MQTILSKHVSLTLKKQSTIKIQQTSLLAYLRGREEKQKKTKIEETFIHTISNFLLSNFYEMQLLDLVRSEATFPSFQFFFFGSSALDISRWLTERNQTLVSSCLSRILFLRNAMEDETFCSMAKTIGLNNTLSLLLLRDIILKPKRKTINWSMNLQP